MLKKKNKFIKLAAKTIGLIVFIYIIYLKINVNNLLEVIKSVNAYYLLPICLLPAIPTLIKLFRWRYILKILGIKYSFKEIFKIYYLSLILGTITPMNSGDAIGKMMLLKKDGHQLKKSFISIIIDRLADFFILIIILIFGAIIFINYLNLDILLILLTFLLLTPLLLLIINTKIGLKIIDFFLGILPEKIKNKIHQTLLNVFESIKKFKVYQYVILLIYTIFSQLAMLLFLYSLTKVVGINQVPILDLLIINSVISFIVLIPITIAGFGTRELSFLYFFSFFGVQSEKSIVFSLLVISVSLVTLLFIGIYLIFYNNSNRFSQ